MYGPVGRSSCTNVGRSSCTCRRFFGLSSRRDLLLSFLSAYRVPAKPLVISTGTHCSELTALHAPLPPPLRPSPASHLRRPRRPWTHGRPHPQPSHCRNRRSSPRQA